MSALRPPPSIRALSWSRSHISLSFCVNHTRTSRLQSRVHGGVRSACWRVVAGAKFASVACQQLCATAGRVRVRYRDATRRCRVHWRWYSAPCDDCQQCTLWHERGGDVPYGLVCCSWWVADVRTAAHHCVFAYARVCVSPGDHGRLGQGDKTTSLAPVFVKACAADGRTDGDELLSGVTYACAGGTFSIAICSVDA